MPSNSQQQSEIFTQYEELMTHILTGLIGDIEKKVTVKEKFGKLSIEIEIPEEIRGYVIGRGGHVIRAIASIINAAAFEVRYPTLVSVLD